MSSLPPASMRARVLDAVEREPAPPRAVGARRRTRALLLGFGAMVAAIAIIGPRLQGRPPGYVAALVSVWLAVAGSATWAGVLRGRSMLGRPSAWRAGVVALTPVALLAGWAAVALAWPTTLADSSDASRHVTCDVVTVLLAIGPLLAFGACRRRSDPVSPRLTGASIGTAAATWAAVALLLVCGFTSGMHMMLGHVAPVALLALIGAVLTARTVAIRAKTG